MVTVTGDPDGGQVTEDAQESLTDTPPVLTDLEPPPCPASPPTFSGPPVPPQHRVYFYESGEWENFIREWATALDAQYVQIKRLGGSNDHGVDVAAFKSDQGFEGSWDCFQGKHYSEGLTFSDACPEMLKVFIGVLHGHYVLPDTYSFLAPKGCGTTLDRLLSKPTELQKKFLGELDKEKGCATSLDAGTRERVRTLAASTDFSIFRSIQLLDVLESHRKTPYFTMRFGGPLPERPPIGLPPNEVAPHESRYVGQLVEVYGEQSGDGSIQSDSLSVHPTFAEHFKRQRIAFYSAEALRLHARDAVPDGTFEALQDDIFAGVVEVAEAAHASGMDRLTQVLTTVTSVQLDGHAALLSVSRMNDRKGICHQLANQDRLTWVQVVK